MYDAYNACKAAYARRQRITRGLGRFASFPSGAPACVLGMGRPGTGGPPFLPPLVGAVLTAFGALGSIVWLLFLRRNS